MELFIYKGEDNLPSIDFECLRVAAFVKLTGAPVTINSSGKTLYSATRNLPYLQLNDKYFTGYNAIIGELKKQGYNLNKQSADIRHLSDAYICLIMKHLYPCLQYFLWGDTQNIDITRSLYARCMTFPLNFIYPQTYTKYADRLLQIEENFSINDKLEDHKPATLLMRCKKELNLLSAKLNNKTHLLDGNYSEADATIYALLASLYYIPVPNNPIKLHIQESPHLQKYIEKFYMEFMKDLPVNRKSTINQSERRTKNGVIEMDDDKYFAQKKPKILAVLIAGLVMTIFAWRQGIFQISHNENRLNIEYDDDDDHEDNL